MATPKKRGPTGKTARKRAPSKKITSKKVIKLKRKPNPLHKEVLSIALIAAAVLLGLAFFMPGSGGFFGSAVKGVMLGLFGVGAIVLLFGLFFGGVYVFFAKATPKASKAVMLCVLFICVMAFAFLQSGDITPNTNSFLDYIAHYYNVGGVGNGGLLGAVFGNILFLFLGAAGAYVVLFAAALIMGILISGRSVYNFAASFGEKLPRHIWEAEDDEDDYIEEEYGEYDDADDNTATFEKAKKSEKPSPRTYTIEERRARDAAVALASEDIAATDSVTILRPSKDKVLTLNIGPKEAGLMPSELEEAETEDFEAEEQAETYVETLGGRRFAQQAEALGEDDITAAMSSDDEPDTSGLRISEYAGPKHKGAESLHSPVFESASDDYTPPPITFLNENPTENLSNSRAQILENSRKLEETLKSFGVEARVVEVSKGPTVTRYELSPGVGVKVSKISGLADDLALNLAAVGIRIEAPIPGKSAVGIEIPNKEVTPVFLREVLEDEQFIHFPSKLAFGLGKDIAGNTVVADIARMPHLLIAGATGSGKSVCVNTLITSIIYKANPNEVKLLMVDPKVVELSIYNGIPHLLIPVVTDPKKAAGALNWAVAEMVTRYNLFAETSVRDLKGYNNFVRENGEGSLLPQIVIIIDELADLMMAAPGEVEGAICRLAQMARAAGIHLIIATQRPSVDVITGLIKANIPSRLAFSVTSGTDSRTILDMNGAEKLLGKGDMLFCPVGMGKPLRVQGAFISDKEVESIVNFIKRDAATEYDPDMIEKITAAKEFSEDSGELDEFFEPAVEFLIQKERASASLLQRQFRIGYNRASRLIEDLEARGIVGPEDGSKPRKVLMTTTQWAEWKARKNS